MYAFLREAKIRTLHVTLAGLAVLVLGGLVLGIWFGVLKSEAEQWMTKGPLRPAMVLLPEQNGARLAIAETEVTQAQYFRVMGEFKGYQGSLNGAVRSGCPFLLSRSPGDFATFGPVKPMVCVTLADARAYANRLSELEALLPCYGEDGLVRSCTGYRLPMMTEWRRAARADQQTVYSGTSDAGTVKFHANFHGRNGPRGLSEIKTLRACPVQSVSYPAALKKL